MFRWLDGFGSLCGNIRDTTRADRLGCYGFEGIRTLSIDRLAREGVLFRNVHAQAPQTFEVEVAEGPIPFPLTENEEARITSYNVCYTNLLRLR